MCCVKSSSLFFVTTGQSGGMLRSHTRESPIQVVGKRYVAPKCLFTGSLSPPPVSTAVQICLRETSPASTSKPLQIPPRKAAAKPLVTPTPHRTLRVPTPCPRLACLTTVFIIHGSLASHADMIWKHPHSSGTESKPSKRMRLSYSADLDINSFRHDSQYRSTSLIAVLQRQDQTIPSSPLLALPGPDSRLWLYRRKHFLNVSFQDYYSEA